MSRHPSTIWAQRSDHVFITVELPDAKDVKMKLEPEGRFSFSAFGADNVPYELDFELFDKIKVDESKAAIRSRHIVYLVVKEEKKWWPRLLKPAGRPPVFLKVDWDKWVDEDEENSKLSGDMDFGGDMDFSKLGMGGPDEFDDDEDDAAESSHRELEEVTETGEAKSEEEEEKKH